MDGGNCSSVTGFIFLGITDNTEDKVTIFIMVLIVYLIGHLAKLGMIFLIKMDPQMHTPMYFFLGHLSFRVLCYFHCNWPQDAKNKSIPFYGCCCATLGLLYLCQFWVSPAGSVAYEQYKPVSSPLLYAVSMSSRVCSLLVAGVYLLATADALIHTTLAFCYVSVGQMRLTISSVTYLHFSSFPTLIYRSMNGHYSLFWVLLSWVPFQESFSLTVISSYQSWRSTLLRGGSKLSPPSPLI